MAGPPSRHQHCVDPIPLRITLRQACAVLVLLPAMVPALHAEDIAQPVWKQGASWHYRATSNFEPREFTWIREVEAVLPGGRYRIRGREGVGRMHDASGNFIGNRGSNRGTMEFNFPLQVGKRWSHERNTDTEFRTGTETSTWEVEAEERIEVPAGTFDCVRVKGTTWGSWAESRMLNQNFNKRHNVTTYWYCPQVQGVARWVVQDKAMTSLPTVHTESVLTAYNPGQ